MQSVSKVAVTASSMVTEDLINSMKEIQNLPKLGILVEIKFFIVSFLN